MPLISVFVCFSVFVCAEEMEGERKATAAVASKPIIHCWSCYNLDYIFCSLKVYFSYKQQSTAHKNSFCLSINNPLVLSPLHTCVCVCVCVYMYLSVRHKQSPILPSGTQSDPSVSPRKTNFTGDVQFFSDTHHISLQRERGKGKRKDT